MDILTPLTPYADKLLYGVGILLIIALLGGTHIHIKDINLGPLGSATRALSAIGGVLLLLAFLLIPRISPGPTFPVHGKIVVGIFPQLAGQAATVTIAPHEDDPGSWWGWLRPSPVYHANVEPDGGNFLFPATKGITEDRYEFAINFKDGRKAYASITVTEEIFLLVVHDSRGTRQIHMHPIDYFKKQYMGDWAKKVQAIGHLGDLVMRYRPDYEPELMKAYENDRTNLRELALWALGSACTTKVKQELEEIYANQDKNPFERLRAGYQLTCFPDSGYVFEDLYERLTAPPLPPSAGSEEHSLRRLAAFFLLKRDRFERCVVEGLIYGATFSKQDAETMVRATLGNKLNWNKEHKQDESDPLDWSMERWRTWFEKAKDNLRPCPQG